MKYWINTVSKDHVLIGKKSGIVQAGHGKKAPLQRLHKGDYILFYSPKTSLSDGETLQSFTALAQITGDEVYQVVVNESFKPFRINARYLDCRETPIRPLIDKLDFIKNKKSWGYPFRFGLFEITRTDFEFIAQHMGITNIPKTG